MISTYNLIVECFGKDRQRRLDPCRRNQVICSHQKVRQDTRNPVGTNNEDHLIRLNTT